MDMNLRKSVSLLLVLLLIMGMFSACRRVGEEEKDPKAGIPEEFQNVDETTPVDGVYQIVSEKGLRNMAEHPDGKFKLLCDIDLGGAELTPIGSESTPFSGKLDGGGFTVQNFTLVAKDSVAGFFGYITGTVEGLTLADYELSLKGSDVTAAGGFVAVNRGTLRDCNTEDSVIRYSGAGNIALGSLAGQSEGATVKAECGYGSYCRADRR